MVGGRLVWSIGEEKDFGIFLNIILKIEWRRLENCVFGRVKRVC